MNAHDSERLAGLFEREGMKPADDVEHADVVLLNTCCIRENADNKLYGHLGHLKSLKARRPGMQIAVGGCLAQKDRELIRQRAPHVDAVFGTHNVAHAIDRLRPLFADLLGALGATDGIRRVRFTSPHPKDLRPETIAAMAETPAVCEHLHLPLQAGGNRTLAAMHRGYTAERYLEKLAAARAEIDDLAVTTDLIVGFPGETEDDFERTLEVVAEAGYDSAYTFIFSPRPGTEAATRDDCFVPAEVTAERFARLVAVVERSALI